MIIWIKLNFYSRSRYCFLGKFIFRSVCHCCWFFVWFISLNSVLSAGYKLTLGWLIFLRIDDSVYRLKSFEKILLVSFQNIASIYFFLISFRPSCNMVDWNTWGDGCRKFKLGGNGSSSCFSLERVSAFTISGKLQSVLWFSILLHVDWNL
jgi:hypothetical protein